MKLLLIINNNIHWQKLALSLSSQQLLTQQDKNINHHDHSKMAAEKRNHFMFKQNRTAIATPKYESSIR